MTLINRSSLKVTPGLLDFGKNALNSEAKKKSAHNTMDFSSRKP